MEVKSKFCGHNIINIVRLSVPSFGHRNRAAVASSRSLPAAFIPRCLASPPAPCHNMRRVSNNSRSLSSPLSFFPPRLLFTCDRERERDLEMKVMVVKSTDSSLPPSHSFSTFFSPCFVMLLLVALFSCLGSLRAKRVLLLFKPVPQYPDASVLCQSALVRLCALVTTS